jgi:glutamyl-tRNA reductase
MRLVNGQALPHNPRFIQVRSGMSILTFGINHKTAPVEIRERVAFAPARLPEALVELAENPGVHEAAILSTCNRTELYCRIDSPEQDRIGQWFCRYHALDTEQIDPYIYTFPNQGAVRHMLRVASGLDSLILGEPQILGQMKTAYSTAKQAGTVRSLLDRLFQHTFAVAKQVRTDTAIGNSPVSVAFAAVSLAKQIFTDLPSQTALLIGAGETIELAARHLHESGIGHMVIANRTVEKAHRLAAEFNGFAIGLDEIPGHLADADITVSSTASPLPILGKGSVERALKKRRHRPMFMVDIAVPRDIEPEVGKLADVYLYTVDDLHEVIQENLQSRQDAAHQAEEIIDTQTSRFMGWLQSLSSVDAICAYRNRGERLRDAELEKAKRLLAAGRTPEDVLFLLARGITNKLMHEPCSRLRQAGFEGRTDLLDAAHELFDLDRQPTGN